MSDNAQGYFWRSSDLGECKELSLPSGKLRYFDRGEGPAVVFVHGWMANANLWRKVVPLLPDCRCISLDLPFGAHAVPMNADADLSPVGCGELVASAIEAIGLRNVTLVGNDSGGAYSQIATAAHPERIAALVLNSCETPYDQFPPPEFIGLKQAAAAGQLARMMEPMRERDARHTPRAYGHLVKHGFDDIVSDSYVLPILEQDFVLRDATKVMRSASIAPIQAAGEKLIAGFDRPVLFIWSEEDKFFPIPSVRRYASALKNARVHMLTDAYSFTPEDQPKRLAEPIQALARGR